MWFPDLIWENIREFLFPVWGRNPWLKKYDKVVASLPTCYHYTQPRRLIKFYDDHTIKFTIELNYLNWFWPDQYCSCYADTIKHSPPFAHETCRRFIKIYSIEYI